MSSNILKDKVVAGFFVTEIERKDFETVTLHDGKLIKVQASKFVARLLHDQATTSDSDYATPRDPQSSLELRFYTWGYKVPGVQKLIHATRKPEGNEFGQAFLKRAEWQRFLQTAMYVNKDSSYPLPGKVFVRIKLAGTKNYLSTDFGGKELRDVAKVAMGDMDEMLAGEVESSADDASDLMGEDSPPADEGTQRIQAAVARNDKPGRKPDQKTGKR